MKLLVFSIIALFLSSNYLIAAERYDVKAFRLVTKLCSACHGTAFYMAKQKDDDEWVEYFVEEDILKDLHKEKPEAIKNLQSKRFTNNETRILKFLIDHSKYAGSVPGCDANFCGTNH